MKRLVSLVLAVLIALTSCTSCFAFESTHQTPEEAARKELNTWLAKRQAWVANMQSDFNEWVVAWTTDWDGEWAAETRAAWLAEMDSWVADFNEWAADFVVYMQSDFNEESIIGFNIRAAQFNAWSVSFYEWVNSKYAEYNTLIDDIMSALKDIDWSDVE